MAGAIKSFIDEDGDSDNDSRVAPEEFIKEYNEKYVSLTKVAGSFKAVEILKREKEIENRRTLVENIEAEFNR